MIREEIIRIAAAEDGTRESPPDSNKTKYGEWYGMNGAKWCAIFVSWVYHHAGAPLGKINTAKGFHYCQSGYNHWKIIAQLTREPLKGDIVLFDWQGDGHCDHTGIFESWANPQKTSFYSWEGNTAAGNDSDGGMVLRRKRATSVVKAFASPSRLQNPSPVYENDLIQRGDRGSEVTVIQKSLHKLGYALKVDGIFGSETELAVIQFQRDHNLSPSGSVTPEVAGAIEEELARPKIAEKRIHTGAYLRRGDTGAAVVALQRSLNRANATPQIQVDGVFGMQTLLALKAYQRENGLKADGIAGPHTLTSLQVEQV